MAARRHHNDHKEGKSYHALKSAFAPGRPKRSALVSIHPNLESAHPMARLTRSRSDAGFGDLIETGSKRKRPVNAATRAAPKRRKAESPTSVDHSDQDDDVEGSEADEQEHSHSEQDDLPEDSDEYLLKSAPRWRLQKLLKEDLIRLCGLAEVDDDLEASNKAELIQKILSTRPSRSSTRRSRSISSRTHSTEAENDAEEESQPGPSRKRPRTIARRMTENFPMARLRGLAASRSASLGNLTDRLPTRPLPARARRTSSQSDQPTTSSQPAAFSAAYPSPRKTRSRARLQGFAKLQANGSARFPSHHPTTDPASPESDLSSLPETESEAEAETAVEGPSSSQPLAQPSPRRLRTRVVSQTQSQQSQSSSLRHVSNATSSTTTSSSRLPKRKARFGGSFHEPSTDEEADELEDDGANEDDAEVEGENDDEVEIEVVEEEEEEEEDDEGESEDAPVSVMHIDSTPTQARRGRGSRSKPPARNKRSTRTRTTQAPTPPSDDEEEVEIEDEDDAAEQDEEEGEGDEEEEEEVEEDDNDELIDPDARVLRNGKIVGDVIEEVDEEDSSFEQEGSSMDTEDADQPDDDATIEADEDQDELDEDEEDDETAESQIDIDSANLKTLLRHRRDELVRLCEVNEVETEGAPTKKQLAQALLQWRDSNTQYPSSPTDPSSAVSIASSSSSSSAATERDVPATRKPAQRRRSQILMPPPKTPLIFRDHIHVSEVPATPPISVKATERVEEDVELDLESLGLTDKEIKPEKIQKLEKIGSGGFKDVFLGKYVGRKVAIAEFRGQLSHMDIKELKLLREFNHPNVVKFFGVSIPADFRSTPVMIISELCPNGDLFDFIRNTQPLPLYGVLSLMRDISRGIEYLHLHNPSIIHRDCKSSNILISSKFTAKITDFGLAKVKQSTRSMVRSLVGTVNWQAPELWHPAPKYDHKVDVFSCGMVYWEMLQWHERKKMYPWEGFNEHAIYDVVGRKGQRPSMHGMRKLWCPEIVELIERMWAQDPRDRPTMSDVVLSLGSMLAKYKP